MANTDIILDNEAYLVDTYSGTASDNLTGGSKIYLRAISTVFPFVNLMAYKPKILVDPQRIGASPETVTANWDRRKSPTSYTGTEKVVITVDGLIDLDSSGSLSADYQLATIGRLWKIWNSPGSMPFGYYDSKIGSALVDSGYDPTIGTPYSAGSIPVTVKDVTFKWDRSSINKLSYSLVLWEDKD